MKKVLCVPMTIIFALLMAFNFSACSQDNKVEQSSENSQTDLSVQSAEENSSFTAQENSNSTAQENSNSSGSVATDSSGTSEDKGSSPSELLPTEVIYTYLEKQKGFTGYKLNTVGATKAKKGFINYEQNTNNITYKSGNEYFQECTSNSIFVSMTHQAYVKGNKVAYRNASGGEITVEDKAKYKETYGVSPDDDALGGYIINSQTLKSVQKTEENNGLCTYCLSLDAKLASANLVKQMKQFGGLNGYPQVHTLTLYLTIKDDWTPTKLVVESTYDISIAVLGDMSCTHHFETEYSLVNSAVVIPNITDFRNSCTNF